MKADSPIRTVEVTDRDGNVTGTKDVVLYAGLLQKAHEEKLRRVTTDLVQVPADENGQTAIIKVEVETERGTFAALGDANPTNVEPRFAPHLIRVAETRAKARALRDAVNIGVVSFEELGGADFAPELPGPGSGATAAASRVHAPQNGLPAGSMLPGGPNARRTANGSPAAMTEAQRRYLFRLLAAKGVQGDAATEFLKKEFAVLNLKDATKAAAGFLIDSLLAGSEAPHAGAQR